MWQSEAIRSALPTLIADLLIGVLTGLGYATISHWFGDRLGLLTQVTIPPLQTRVVILGGGYAGVAAALNGPIMNQMRILLVS